ncbi:ComEA family DNA-binding protein [Flavobacterium turcicum]|uniref:Helix-hairpin-helix domain-containing protein n=1 Tax=Flavobacterium turcicum TaxID=2764718 RepID=A0ABR7JJ56_9FLAO|nr:helix-hairpin-helix domain-containing protein [Flavobacterium turcicum]MBC5864524.1 helix-hairpin-helix domain-containing protein [Flavobacterium turcicum]NHL03291.1 helix-hairpin-helix domain-containing protein [Flavobacterium turcicum]
MKGLQTIVSYFNYTKQQRTGVLILLVFIVILQSLVFFCDWSVIEKKDPKEQTWLALQSTIDTLSNNAKKASNKIYKFNPNFISDYKGYNLGMSVLEIDRLFAFRKQNKYVNSAAEFQMVTQISDSLLKELTPMFQFPTWVSTKPKGDYTKKSYDYKKAAGAKEKIIVKDINLANQDDLMKIYGVGEALSARIIKQRSILGGFVSMEQLTEIWGLSPEVVLELNTHFHVSALPAVLKLNINNASLKELSQFYYFKGGIARDIITYRSMKGDFAKIEDLTKIKGFPVDKAKIIALYLDFR